MKELYKKDYTYKTSIVFEHELDINGYPFLVIFGKHIKGAFIAIPNWGICCEANAEGSYKYNFKSLISTGLDRNSSETIAKHINAFCKKTDGDIDLINDIDKCLCQERLERRNLIKC